MENFDKKRSSLKVAIIILSILAVVLLATIIITLVFMVKNQNTIDSDKTVFSKNEDISLYDYLDDNSNSILDSGFEEIEAEKLIPLPPMPVYKFKVPEVPPTQPDPFESIAAMDKFARENPDSYLGTVHFKYGKSDVDLDELVKVMDILHIDQLATTYFIIEGHTDSTSEWDFNKELSETRAAMVKATISSQYNIPTSHIMTTGYSWDRLLVKPEKTKEDYAKNRRVEISVFKYE